MSKANRIGLFGCSNLYGYHHAFADAVLGANKLEKLNAYLDEHVYNTKNITDQVTHNGTTISNHSFPGCGNTYINEMLKQKLDDMDYVFVQFTGLTRIDVPGYVEGFPFQHNGWVFSGGQNGYWKQHDTTVSMFTDHYSRSTEDTVQDNLAVIKQTVDMLEQSNKPYNWCFYYDLAKTNKEDHKPLVLDTNNKFIDSDPHTHCFTMGKGADDGVHFMYDGYRDWLCKIKHQLNLPR